MARNVKGRVMLIGTLVAETPLHVGGHGPDVDTDLPLARNGAGRCYIPGTSLAGVLRAWCGQALGPASRNSQQQVQGLVRELWGYQEQEQGHASYVFVEDAEISRPFEIEIRDGVGIDRRYGCAAEHIKYDRAVLPAGTMLPLRVAVDYSEDGRERALAMLDALGRALAGRQLVLGAGGTRGLGRVKLQGKKLLAQDFASRQGILAVVRSVDDGEPVGEKELEAARASLQPREKQAIRVTVEWEPRGPLMVKAGLEGLASDMLPLVSHRGKQLHLVLPGSSIKGALRSRAECIMRTLLDQDASQEKDPKRRFLDDVRVPLIDEAFGVRGLSHEERKRDPAWNRRQRWNVQNGPQPGRGALSAEDCYAKAGLDTDDWQTILSADDDRSLRAALQKAHQRWQQAYHVAVDRWTGGAAESFLYTVLEPHGVEWEPLQLELDLERLISDFQMPAAMLLLLLLRDLADGRLPLGFGTNRGLGAVTVKSVEFRVSGLPTSNCLAALHGQKLVNGNVRQLASNLPQALDAAWSKCLTRLKT